MTWSAVAGAAVSVVGGYLANKSANKGAGSQAAAGQAAIDEQRRQYDQTRSDLLPYMDFGASAIPWLTKLNSGDYSGFLDSPDYLAARDMGQDQIDHSAAARGGLFGGGHTRDTIQFGSNLASQYLGNYRNSLFQQAGMGQNAAAGLGGLGQSSANAIGNAYGSMGDARATAYNNQAQLYGGIAGSLSNLANNYFAGRSGSSYGPNSGSIYANQVRTGPGSVYNFGNNMGNFVNTGWGG